jgi:hypothetical protein
LSAAAIERQGPHCSELRSQNSTQYQVESEDASPLANAPTAYSNLGKSRSRTLNLHASPSLTSAVDLVANRSSAVERPNRHVLVHSSQLITTGRVGVSDNLIAYSFHSKFTNTHSNSREYKNLQ